MAEDRERQREMLIAALAHGRESLYLNSASFHTAVHMLADQLVDVMGKCAAIAEGQAVSVDDRVEEILRGDATSVQEYGRAVRRQMEGR